MARTSQKPSRRPRSKAEALREQVRSGNFGRAPVLRLLPAVIIAALCMLGFRVQVVVQDIADTRTSLVQMGQSSAFAQQQQPGAALVNGGVIQDEAMSEDMVMNEEGMAETIPVPQSADFDPTRLTQSEIETLQRLAERRELIEERERELQVKEGLLRAAETRIDGKISQLQDLEQSIEGLLAQYDEQKQGEILQLVNIYGAMKPKDAARIFDTLEMPILVSVVQTMKETKVAPILAAMNPRKATALTEELTVRRTLPGADMGPG